VTSSIASAARAAAAGRQDHLEGLRLELCLIRRSCSIGCYDVTSPARVTVGLPQLGRESSAVGYGMAGHSCPRPDLCGGRLAIRVVVCSFGLGNLAKTQHLGACHYDSRVDRSGNAAQSGIVDVSPTFADLVPCPVREFCIESEDVDW